MSYSLFLSNVIRLVERSYSTRGGYDLQFVFVRLHTYTLLYNISTFSKNDCVRKNCNLIFQPLDIKHFKKYKNNMNKFYFMSFIFFCFLWLIATIKLVNQCLLKEYMQIS